MTCNDIVMLNDISQKDQISGLVFMKRYLSPTDRAVEEHRIYLVWK